MEQLNIQKLIQDISPLYNSYKQTSRDISGTDSLYIMWDIGNVLKNVIDKSKIPPHNLYRKIYGKSEGSTDIQQKSYITREFLGRAYRIRNIFTDKNEILEQLPSLKNFILFREAMPFFDNPKYKFVGKEKQALLKLLNSKESSASILKKVKSLQKEKIGRTNNRTQRLVELENEKQAFITFYNYLFNLIKTGDYASIAKEFSDISSSDLAKISSATSCLAQEGLKYPELPSGDFNEKCQKYTELIKNLASQTDPKERRRFRRLIPPSRIVRLAEMLQAISSKESYKSYLVSKA
jgi:hypothetical protein